MPINPTTGQSYRITDDGKVRQHIYGSGPKARIVKIASKVAAQKALPGVNLQWNGRAWVAPKMKPLPTPMDSVYGANMAVDRSQREQQVAGLNQQNQIDQTDTAEALRRLSMQRAQANQGFNARAARQGSLLSGKAMQGFGYQDTGYQQRQGDIQDQLARRLAQRQQSIAGVNQGALAYEQAQRAQAADRAAQNAWNNRLAALLAGRKM
jgi:hypothetical protein